jgi:hypothetical protein
MAEERTHPYKEKNFFERYQSLLEWYWFPLMTNANHRGKVEEIKDLCRNSQFDISSKKNFEEKPKFLSTYMRQKNLAMKAKKTRIKRTE